MSVRQTCLRFDTVRFSLVILRDLLFLPFRLVKKSRFLGLSVLVRTIVFGLSVNSYAASDTLKLAMPDNFPPFYYQDQSGAFHGASIEIVSQLCRDLGYQVEVTQFQDMRSMLSAIAKGQQDIAINLTATKERLDIALFTETPHVTETHNLIVRSDFAENFSGNLSELDHLRFGAISGWTFGPEFDNATYLKKGYATNTREQMSGLLAGSYDVVINNPQSFLYLTKQMQLSSAFKVLEPSVYQLPVTIGISKRHPEAADLKARLEQAVKEFRTTRQYQEILLRYGFSSAESAFGSVKQSSDVSQLMTGSFVVVGQP